MKRHRGGAPESDRDQNESAFTPTLRRLWAADPNVLAVAFVDSEGECVDYCTSLDPFEAKVAGAHMLVVTMELVDRFRKIGHGQAFQIIISCSQRDLMVRRVSDEYLLLLLLEPGGQSRAVFRALAAAVHEIRQEGHMREPDWEPHATPVDVSVRDAVGWGYAPRRLTRRGSSVPVAAVLGRWIPETGGAVCFRVRVEGGEELTLAHETRTDSWTVLKDSWQ